MVSFIEFLHEIEQSHQTVFIDSLGVESLVKRFGPEVRTMGVWNHATDGSLEIPMSNITEVARKFTGEGLAEAVAQLETGGELTEFLSSSSAAKALIQALSRLHLQQLQTRIERYQESANPDEVAALRNEISREIFGA